jgi:hypothetical protein
VFLYPRCIIIHVETKTWHHLHLLVCTPSTVTSIRQAPILSGNNNRGRGVGGYDHTWTSHLLQHVVCYPWGLLLPWDWRFTVNSGVTTLQLHIFIIGCIGSCNKLEGNETLHYPTSFRRDHNLCNHSSSNYVWVNSMAEFFYLTGEAERDREE